MKQSLMLVLIATLSAATAAGAACLKPNVDGQDAEGTLTTGRFHDAAGRSEQAYILQLTSSACLDADEADEAEAVKSTRTIHVFPADDKLEPTFRKLVGKSVTVRGSPFAAHTAHHHAPIVMQVSEIKPR